MNRDWRRMRAAVSKTDSDLPCRGAVDASALLSVHEMHRRMAELGSGPEYDRIAALYNETRTKFWNGKLTPAELAALQGRDESRPAKPRPRRGRARKAPATTKAPRIKPARAIDDHLWLLIEAPGPENDFWTLPQASTLVDIRSGRIRAEMKHPPRRSPERAIA